METRTYKYAPVDKQSRQIRLVNLLPGSADDAIVCTTHVVSLDDQPRYEALSYTWGDPAVTHPIVLDGVDFDVTTNLHAALKGLRKLQAPRVLWIDAICINQNDDDEKSWQVAMMGDIYKSCSHGLMWLGEESEGADEWCENEDGECGTAGGMRLPGTSYPADLSGYRCKWHGRRPMMKEGLELLEYLARDKHVREIPCLAHLMQAGDQDELQLGEPIQAVGAFCRRAWWSRIWTVQEVILPCNLTMICGPLHLTWSTMVAAIDNLAEHNASCCQMIWQKIMRRVTSWMHGTNTIEALSIARGLVLMIEPRREEQWNRQYKQRPYFQVWQDFSSRRSTDPRDKLYALLGLYPPDDQPFEVDYRIDKTELNKRVIFLLIHSPTAPLMGMCRSIPRYDPLDIPSWMKDFVMQPLEVYGNVDSNRRKTWARYNCSSFENSLLNHGIPQICSENILSAVGIHIGKVDIIGTVAHTTSKEASVQTIRDWSTLIPMEKNGPVPYVTNDGTTLESAFLRTILGDTCPANDWTPRQVTDADLQDWKTIISPPFDQTLSYDQMVFPTTLYSQLWERRFFVTDTGFMGVGPLNMQYGDEVWALFGSFMPFVLRPLHCDDSQSARTRIAYHSVVEECYVHGIMYGQAIRDGMKEQLVFLK